MPLTFTSSGKVSDATYSKPSSNKSSNTSSNSSGGGGYISWFDRIDGGGPGRSGARFSSGDTGGLDQNQDNYISEQEYQRGQSNSESNADRGILDALAMRTITLGALSATSQIPLAHCHGDRYDKRLH